MGCVGSVSLANKIQKLDKKKGNQEKEECWNGCDLLVLNKL